MSPGGFFALNATAANLNDRMANLDIKLELYDASGNLQRTSDRAGDVHADIYYSSAAGTVHYLHAQRYPRGNAIRHAAHRIHRLFSSGHYSIELRSLGTLSLSPATWAFAPAVWYLSSGLSAGTLAVNNPATGLPWQGNDFYRYVFVTSSQRNAASNNIADYNAFVQSVAQSLSLGLGAVGWKVIGSTGTVDARDNTETNPLVNGLGQAIYLVDGSSLVAKGYNELWNGSLQSAIGGRTKMASRVSIWAWPQGQGPVE